VYRLRGNRRLGGLAQCRDWQPLELIDEGELRDMLPLRDGLTLDQLQLAHKERTARAYQAYDEELRNTWRTP
jgi:hypothetical protein